MKPRKKQPGNYRAAREKIAADLAHDLGLCVPPVILAVRRDCPENEEANVCVSLVLYARQWSWQQLRPAIETGASDDISTLARDAMSVAAPLAFAFDTWVGQYDHMDHPHNIVFGYAPERPQQEHSFVFLDFSFSMGYDGRWAGEQYKEIQPAGFPALMRQSMTDAKIQAAVEAIEALDDAAIEEIVTRIPGSHLDETNRYLIKEALCYRKEHLGSALLARRAAG